MPPRETSPPSDIKSTGESSYRPDHERCLARIRRGLSAEEFEAAWREGRRLGREAALNLALAAAAEMASKPAARRLLSKREELVAALVAEGLTNREIARRLSLSERTAESHVEHIRNKLGFHSRSQVAAWAAEKALRQVGR